jgi:hypothetical protein
MPASIAHMLIGHKALELLRTKATGDVADFATMLNDPTEGKRFQAYMNLGTVGPDLYYYASIAQSAKDMIKDGFIQATGVTPWAYHLHSYKPNEFPLSLSQIIFTDAVRDDGEIKLDDDDIRKLAYIAGHLTHIAADQIIHPLVNEIAKPYYRSSDSRKKHRECEVFQDYYLYEEVYRDKRQTLSKTDRPKYDFFEQDFNKWVDCVTSWTTRNTEDWFRYFLQRGFVETCGTFPPEEMIEDSVDNLLLMLRACKLMGPYKKAQDEYSKYGAESQMYKQYIAEPEYVKYYEQAVRLAAVYVTALFEVYSLLKAGGDFTGKEKGRFLSIVNGADLSCPLEQNILDKAYKALMSKRVVAGKYKDVFAS